MGKKFLRQEKGVESMIDPLSYKNTGNVQAFHDKYGYK